MLGKDFLKQTLRTFRQDQTSYCVVVVNLSIVAEPHVGKLLDAQRLHPIQLVHNSEAVEAKATVGEPIDILKAESIRTPVSNFHGRSALNRQALIAAKQSPDTTHFTAENRKRKKRRISYQPKLGC